MQHILIIRFSSIGDIVLTSPVVRCVKQQFPDAQLHFATKPSYAALLQDNPHIDHLHLLDGTLLQLVRQLKTFRFDYILDLHHNQRTTVIKTLLGQPSGSFPKENWTKWRMVRQPSKSLTVPHVVERYFMAGAQLGLKSDDKGLEHFISPHDKVNLDITEPFIAAGIGGSFATKVFPLVQWKKLIPMLQHPVVLLGGPEDKPMADELQALFPYKVYHQVGYWSIQQSASAIQQSAMVISNDTGMMHLAAAHKKPLAVIWGNTVQGFGMGPYYGPSTPTSVRHFEVEGLSCRPCSKLGHDACPKQHFHCMTQQSPEAIAAFVREILPA